VRFVEIAFARHLNNC